MASPSSYQSLLQWRPRYWLPACVSRMGLDPTTLRSRLAMALGTLILLSWVIACWAFHDQMTAPGQEDKFLAFMGLGGTLMLTVGVLLPAVLVDAFALHRWLLIFGPVPVPSEESGQVDAFLRRNPAAGAVLLEWLVRQRVDYPRIAHAQKLLEVSWDAVSLPEPVPTPAWGLEEVVTLARLQMRTDDLDQALPPPAFEQRSARPRL